MSGIPQQQRVDFVGVLAELKNGRALNDCSRKLTELTEAVTEHRKKGKLILELVIEPSGVDDDRRVTETRVMWNCRIAKPEADTGSSTFFVTRDGRLTRNDPAQEEMFAEVEIPQEERRNV
jgi:hypothetical protein